MDGEREANASGGRSAWREWLHEVIFGIDTPAGRAFDVILLWAILLSVLAVMLDSVASIREQYGPVLRIVEWVFTILFTIEYAARLASARRPLRYATSFYGIVDFAAILPTYLSLFFGGAQSLTVIRALRLLRMFRVLKLVRYVEDAELILDALHNSRRKITAFLGSVLIIALIVGTLMYLIEGRQDSGFTSIPESLYWAIVTLTTVGFGDITPVTPVGKALASLLMITGYSIIAVPTGIVSVEIAQARDRKTTLRACPECGVSDHQPDAEYCRRCGTQLPST